MRFRPFVLAFSALFLTVALSRPAHACWGVRPMAMGGGFTAVADDSNAAYWNAAGLAQVPAFEVTGSAEVLGYNPYSGGPRLFNQENNPNAYLETLNMALPVHERVGLGVSAEWSGQGSYMINPGFGVRIGRRFFVGSRLSYWNLGSYPASDPWYEGIAPNAWDLSMDLDLLWNINPHWSAGLHMESFWTLASTMTYAGPPLFQTNYRPAIAWRPNEAWTLNAAIYDLTYEPGFSFGGEYAPPAGHWAVRAGWYNLGQGGDPGYPTMGFGYRFDEHTELGYMLFVSAYDPAPVAWSHTVGVTWKATGTR